MSLPKSHNLSRSADHSPVVGYLPPDSPPLQQNPTPQSTNPHVFPPIPSPTSFDKDAESGYGGAAKSFGRRRQLFGGRLGQPSWDGAWKYSWIIGPMLGYGSAITLLLIAMWKQGNAYGVVQQVGGTGRIDYGITGSCAIAPGTTLKICESRSLYANFVPSLHLIASAVPGYALLHLPFTSVQTPTIFFAGLILAMVSFVVYLPVWICYNFPRSSANLIPRPLLRLVRRYPWWFYQFAAILNGASFVVTMTIGIGYELYMQAFALTFENWLDLAFYTGLTNSQTTRWTFTVGNAFGIVWAAVTILGLTTLSTAAALHNGFDETIEYQDVSYK